MPRTVGVEQELVLVDLGSGEPAPRAAQVVSQQAPGVVGEFKQEQVEVVSAPHVTLEDLDRDLSGRRHTATQAAAHLGLGLAAVGAWPGVHTPTAVRSERFDRIESEFGQLARQQLTCGTHVHVAVSSREEGVAVLDRIRPWLALLTALSANSPYWQGVDTGHASYRAVILSGLPTSGPAPVWGSVAAYDRSLELVTRTGAAFDAAMIYHDVRLSHRFPTVEVRVADVSPHPRDTLLQAALCRGLVETAAGAAGEPPLDVPTTVLRGAAWRAARHGLDERLYDPVSETLVSARQAVGRLVDHVRPALEDADDLELVLTAVEGLFADGNGAQRLRSQGGPVALLPGWLVS